MANKDNYCVHVHRVHKRTNQGAEGLQPPSPSAP